MQHHFVVTYDTETGAFLVDADTAHAVLPDGPIYDPASGGWRLDDYEDGHAEVAAVLADLIAREGAYVRVRD